MFMAKHGWILIAEDNEEDEVVEVLQQTGHKIVIARNGAEALSCLRREGKYSLRPVGDPMFVLLKCRLPVYDGLLVLRTIKEDLHMMHLPVVIYARSVMQERLEAAYVWGVNGYIVKPRTRTEMVRVFSCVGQFWGVSNIHPGSRNGSALSGS
jgi:CheY-like chemotaxis protein